MYNLYYFAWSPQLLCTFKNYIDCKKALDRLLYRYPGSKIWMSEVSGISCFEEFEDKFKCKIPEYERMLKPNEINKSEYKEK